MLMDRFGMPMFFFEKDAAGGSGGGNDEGEKSGNGDGEKDKEGEKPQSFDTWIEEQDETVQTLIEDHTQGLKSALESERDERDRLQKQLKKMADEAEEGSEAQKKLQELSDDLEEQNRKADFYEAAHAAGVRNLKLAYLVATEEGLFDRRGTVNFETMKTEYPELFESQNKAPKGGAGDGTDNDAPGGEKDMNKAIRAMAGRQ